MTSFKAVHKNACVYFCQLQVSKMQILRFVYFWLSVWVRSCVRACARVYVCVGVVCMGVCAWVCGCGCEGNFLHNIVISTKRGKLCYSRSQTTVCMSIKEGRLAWKLPALDSFPGAWCLLQRMVTSVPPLGCHLTPPTPPPSPPTALWPPLPDGDRPSSHNNSQVLGPRYVHVVKGRISRFFFPSLLVGKKDLLWGVTASIVSFNPLFTVTFFQIYVNTLWITPGFETFVAMTPKSVSYVYILAGVIADALLRTAHP